MQRLVRKSLRLRPLLGLMIAISAGCGCAARGPAERAGRGIDRGVQGAKDVIVPPGPVEKVGRDVDRVIKP